MNTATLDASDLRTAARLLTSDAEQLWEQTDWLGRGWTEIADAGFSGTGATAALNRLALLTQPFALPPTQMVRVADTLATTASLQEHLDAAASQAIALADRFADGFPLVTSLLRDLRTLGELLDWACARQIDLLCTPFLPDPASKLSDVPELSTNAIHELNLLDASPELTQLVSDHPDLRLLETSGGRLVATIGPLDTADSVSTIVAGVGSFDPAGWDTQVNRARSVSTATGGASVIWLGYQAPAALPQALAAEPARRAALELRDFQAELARRNPTQQRTVIGYSYGSVVAGAAASTHGGLFADDLILLGSPGVGVGHADQLNLMGNDPQVHAVINPNDPISLAATTRDGIHGKDPTAPDFGARVWSSDPHGDHSSYWEDPIFLGQLADIRR